MFNWIRKLVLHFARLPHDPTPPSGAPGSIRVFRAGRNYYKIKLCRWGIGQIGAVVGICFSLWFLDKVEADVRELRAPSSSRAPAAAATIEPRPASTPPPSGTTKERRRKAERKIHQQAAQMIGHGPDWIVPVLRFLEYAAICIFVVQLPVSFTAVRLEFELHWYIVTDRSLRIRTGLVKVQESTMSFANLQQVEMKQGPLQRLLGLGDVYVQSAGGGDSHKENGKDSLHTGVFQSVDNAPEIRDLIVERLRQFRQAGLGDPDDHPVAHSALATETPELLTPPPSGALAAAQELLIEARALRQTLC